MTRVIDSSYMLSTYKEAKSKQGSNVLGKDDFLKLLITQLKHQDPTNPMNDTEFVAQMTSFSILEQLTNMKGSLNQLVEQNKQSQWLSFHQLIGQDVTWQKAMETGAITEGRGTVTGVHLKEDDVVIILDNGTELQPAHISQVNNPVKESALTQASMMIGKMVTYLNDEQKEVSAMVQSVAVKNGQLSFYLNDAFQTVLTPAQIIKITNAGGV